MDRKFMLLAVALSAVGVVLIVAIFARERKSGEANLEQDFIPGGIYTIEDGAGKYGVAKVLVVEPEAVHVRVYKNKFDARPSEIDPTTLSLGSVLTDEEFGIGHLPLAREGFANWRPVLILQTTVTEEELVGYELWKDGGSVREP
jgi:hypothetical protein